MNGLLNTLNAWQKEYGKGDGELELIMPVSKYARVIHALFQIYSELNLKVVAILPPFFKIVLYSFQKSTF